MRQLIPGQQELNTAPDFISVVGKSLPTIVKKMYKMAVFSSSDFYNSPFSVMK